MTLTVQGQSQIPGPELSDDIRDTLQLSTDAIATVCKYNDALEPEWIIGLARPFTPRARKALLALLVGATEREAGLRAGISEPTFRKWKHESPAFMEAVHIAREAGTAIYESELNRRALAGKDDPGSANLLKLKLQSVDDTYRDKRESNVTVFNIRDADVGPVLGAWKQRRVIEAEATEVQQGTPSATESIASPTDGDESTAPQGTGGG